MIIDCHYHYETRLLSTKQLIEKMDASGVDKTALMGVLLDPFTEPPQALVNLLQFFITRPRFRWIGKLFVANFTENGVKILGKDIPLYKDPDNVGIFDAVDKHPDRFLGWVFVNPKGTRDPVAEFEKYKDHQGFIGVKPHPFWHHYAPERLAAVAERLAETGKPMLMHLGYGSEGDYGALLRKVPNLKLILAHTGFPGYQETWKDMLGQRNVFVDLSQTSYVGEKTIKQAVDFLGPDRCLFGTDGPYGFHAADGKFDYGLIKRRIEKIFSDRKIRAKLLGENFAALAGL